jgi:hypothetical protein
VKRSFEYEFEKPIIGVLVAAYLLPPSSKEWDGFRQCGLVFETGLLSSPVLSFVSNNLDLLVACIVHLTE